MVGRRSLSTRWRPASVFTPFLRRFTDERARELQETIDLYTEVRAQWLTSDWSSQAAIGYTMDRIVRDIGQYVTLPETGPIREALDQCLYEILALETTIFSCPTIDWSTAVLSLKEQVDLRRFLRAKEHFLANERRLVEL